MRRLFPGFALAAGIAALTATIALNIDRGPFARTPVGAEGLYWHAAGLAAQGKLSAENRAQLPSPLYPLLLSPIGSAGSAAGARRTLTLIALPLFALLVAGWARRRAGPWPAVLAGWASVIVAPVVLDAGAFTPAVPAALLALAALLLLDGKRTWGGWALGGGLLGLALRFESVLGWSTVALLLGATLWRPGGARRLVAAGAFTAGLIVALGGVHLADRANPLVPRLSGIEFYRGHRDGASGMAPRRGDADDRRWWTPTDYLREASHIEGRKLSPHAAGVYWLRKGAQDAISHPAQELRRIGVRVLGIYGGEPIPRSVGVTYLLQQGEGWALPASVWAARILLPLGLVGLAARWRLLGVSLVVGTLSGLLAASVTYLEPDLRLVSLAAILVGIAHLARTVVDASPRRRMIVGGAGLAAIAVFGIWPARGAVPGHGVRPEDHVNLGLLFDQEGRGSAAIREYERALSLDPDDPYPYLAIAALLSRDNAISEAIQELEHLRTRHPDSVPALLWLTRLYQNEKRWMEAAAVYTDLIRLEPWDPEHVNNLGTMYVQMGFFDQAVAALQAALQVDPTYATARDNLRSLQEQGFAPGVPAGSDSLRAAEEEILSHLRAGDSPGAEAALDRAYRQFGRDKAVLTYVEGTLRLMTGEPEKAVVLLESASARMPDNPILLNNLGTAYAHVGRYREAEATFVSVLRLQPSNQPVQNSLASVRAVLDSLSRTGDK